MSPSTEGTAPADSGTFFIIYLGNYKPRSDGIPGHGLNVRLRPKANIRYVKEIPPLSGVFFGKRVSASGRKRTFLTVTRVGKSGLECTLSSLTLE